ncbi:chaperonin GroEL [Ralstonia sp. CHL-2022]|uniref:60 kDa chaperonin n=1 Tax=Ralstonia mojiangensis TaxID=2953895 RepID=A0AAE3I7C5_9RALS|nr:chaperonin GroEL [Ralstonia mojiangensis]MCT7318715.1 chaperonin GroEL [Ralstonia mojiangensis]MCT7329375.1 chaperonin GroEL [Ralstonia mojiangensis]
MTARTLVFHQTARRMMLNGIDLLARAVKVTLGPGGRNVIIERPGTTPMVANSGVVVARSISLREPFADMGARLLCEAAARTSEVAGDGTTTATTLAHAIVAEGVKYVEAGHDPMQLRRGIEAAGAVVAQQLHDMARPCTTVDEMRQIATISASGDQTVGSLVARAVEQVGKDGAISVEDGSKLEDQLEIAKGARVDRGFLSPFFATTESRAVVLEEPWVLLCDVTISSIAQLLPILEAVSGTGKPLLVIANEVEGEALATLVVNNLRGTLKSCAIRSPGFGESRTEQLADLAALTGATVISSQTGVSLEHATLDQLGRVHRTETTKDATTLIAGDTVKTEVDRRIGQLRAQLDEAKTDYDREQLQHRLARLSGGVAVIKVGAATETALHERKNRFQDALHATRAAVDEGIVPGGGVALLRARSAIDAWSAPNAEQHAGAHIVHTALAAPMLQIAANAGADAQAVVHQVLSAEGSVGYDAASDRYGDMLELGVVDPVKVVRTALQNAISIAALLLTTDCMIAEAREGYVDRSDEASSSTMFNAGYA